MCNCKITAQIRAVDDQSDSRILYSCDYLYTQNHCSPSSFSYSTMCLAKQWDLKCTSEKKCFQHQIDVLFLLKHGPTKSGLIHSGLLKKKYGTYLLSQAWFIYSLVLSLLINRRILSSNLQELGNERGLITYASFRFHACYKHSFTHLQLAVVYVLLKRLKANSK